MPSYIFLSTFLLFYLPAQLFTSLPPLSTPHLFFSLLVCQPNPLSDVSRVEIYNNQVKWHSNFEFPCKMTASMANGVLDPCFVRISVRKVSGLHHRDHHLSTRILCLVTVSSTSMANGVLDPCFVRISVRKVSGYHHRDHHLSTRILCLVTVSSTSMANGVLDPCFVRISVRKVSGYHHRDHIYLQESYVWLLYLALAWPTGCSTPASSGSQFIR